MFPHRPAMLQSFECARKERTKRRRVLGMRGAARTETRHQIPPQNGAKARLYLEPSIAASMSRTSTHPVSKSPWHRSFSSGRCGRNRHFHAVLSKTAPADLRTHNCLCSVSDFPMGTASWMRRCAMTHAVDWQTIWRLQRCEMSAHSICHDDDDVWKQSFVLFISDYEKQFSNIFCNQR